MNDPAQPATRPAPWDAPADQAAEGRNTDPKTVLVGALAAAQNAVIPALLITFGSGGFGLLIAVPIFLAILGVGTFFSFLTWKRLTYTIGTQDIRVESGLLSRSARSVPYERIQDVSLEQKLLPRLFGLVAVKFETGAGGGEDLSLSYLSEAEGERLRQLVRERRDDQTEGPASASASAAAAADASASDGGPQATSDEGSELFAMGMPRLFLFGTFEFSLAVFAVLLGLLQYADSFIDLEIWDPDLWREWVEAYGIEVNRLDRTMQAFGAIAGVAGLFAIGTLTGLVRTFARDWGFLLERTARGFRRRRGLFTKTDVVMPIHRVQGIKIGTRLIRYRFGWHSLNFVSLAQDMGASNHVVAPFAKLDEIEPIVEAAGFSMPDDQTDWHLASGRYMFDKALIGSLGFLIAALAGGIATSIYSPEWTMLVVGVLLVIAGISAMARVFAWRFQRHALDHAQIMASRGLFSPRSQIATRLKLHSVEIAQGPLARLRGYATLHLGQAGGTFAIPGVPIERAREVRQNVLETIAATDFSQLESARPA